MEINLREQWKLIAVIVGGAATLAILITIITTAAGNARRTRLEEQVRAAEQSVELPLTMLDELRVTPDKLMLPPSADERWLGEYQPLYPERRQWGIDELRQYLYDPREIGSESLRTLNEKTIDDLLDQYR